MQTFISSCYVFYIVFKEQTNFMYKASRCVRDEFNTKFPQSTLPNTSTISHLVDKFYESNWECTDEETNFINVSKNLTCSSRKKNSYNATFCILSTIVFKAAKEVEIVLNTSCQKKMVASFLKRCIFSLFFNAVEATKMQFLMFYLYGDV